MKQGLTSLVAISAAMLAGCGGGSNASTVAQVPPPASVILPASPAAAPAPAPAPASTRPTAVLSEGDSISSGASTHTGLYSASRPNLTFFRRAVGGSGIGQLIERLPADLALNPTHATVLIGANDLVHWSRRPASEWVAQLFAYTDQLRAAGVKVVVGTILPQCVTPQPDYLPTFIRQRAEANAAIRAAVGIRIDAVIDFAADRRFGDDADACDTALYQDGIHPTALGQRQMLEVYSVAVDAALLR